MKIAERIAAPPERVFALATDSEHAADRIRGIDSIQILTLGDVGLGTRWRETRMLMGNHATVELTVGDFRPGRSYTTKARACGCECKGFLTCEPVNGGTRRPMTFDAQPTSIGARVVTTLFAPLDWLMQRQAQRRLAEDLADLCRAAAGAERHRRPEEALP
ncbi:SRPBCC family protein [Botrimarina sp.]|uniref:SRPBCC family protein n=1 Tax=Botrimarina sp. TaxID=2795802 RepID=UPI0032EF6DA3